MKLLLLTIISILALNSYSQIVNIPDVQFKAYLVGNTSINTNSDGEIQVTEATVYTGQINCSNLGISDLTGIEAFPNIFGLSCHTNQLTSLDVTQNTALTTLNCVYNQLASLDVSQNTALNFFTCYNNQLTSLDVLQNNALIALSCRNNQLTSLDVSQNTSLTNLECDSNQLQCLNANNGQNFSLNCIGNQLNCISTFDPVWSNANAFYDLGVSFQVVCEPSLNINIVQSGTLLTAEQNGATYQWLDCDNNFAIINGATNQSYTASTSGYYAVELTITSDCGGVKLDTSSCTLVDFIGIEELNPAKIELVKIVDLLGRETPFKPNTPLIYIYSDGTTERVFSLEQ